MILLDTNIILRFILDDDPQLSPKARKLIENIQQGETKVHISLLAVSAVIFTLERSYKLPKLDIVQKLPLLFQLQNIVVEQENLLKQTFIYYINKNVSFIDSYHAAFMEKKRIKGIYSFDRDFDKFPKIKRLEN